MASQLAVGGPVAQGNVGAGAGARSGGLKGGLGTASLDFGNGIFVGAIVAVNSGGSTVNPATEEFYARYLELDDEFGVLKKFKAGKTSSGKGPQIASLAEFELVKNTTIAVVATNFKLTKAQAQKIAQMAHDGLARAIDPIHTMGDGDTVFSAATGQITPEMGIPGWTNMTSVVSRLGAAAANTLARAVIHAMLNAESVGTTLSYRDRYPEQVQNWKK